jgi:hypothetical protein
MKSGIMKSISSPSDRALQLALVLAFLGSRVVFHLLGVRFDLRPLDTSWHILDPVLLREDLLRSALSSPAQPPLYNLMLGAVLKLGSDPALLAGSFRVLYGAMSLGTCLLLFQLLRRLGIKAGGAWFASALFMVSPALALYECIPYYELPVLLLLTLAGLQCHRALECPARRRFFWLFMSMAALIWLRPMFQIQWFVTLLAFCIAARPRQWRSLLRAASLPLLLVLALYGKNLVISGQLATSSWLGMSLVKHTVHQLPLAEREQLVEQGALSPLALRNTTFDPPDMLPAYFSQQPATGIAALDQRTRSTGHPNFHHLAYVAVSRQALHDALYVIEHHPRLYLRSVGEAFLMFLRPASDYPYLRPNRDAIERWASGYARFVAGQPRYVRDPWFVREPGTMGYVLLTSYALCAVAGLAWLVRRQLRGGRPVDVTLGFLWLNIMYVSFLGNALEIGENQRFRFQVHPFMIAILCVLVARTAAAWRKARLGSRLRERVSDLPTELRA